MTLSTAVRRVWISLIPAISVVAVGIGCTSAAADSKQTKRTKAEPAIDFSQVKSPSLYDDLNSRKDRVENADRPLDKLTISGRILKKDGQLSAGACIECWSRSWLGEQLLVARAVSGDDGTYTLDVTPLRTIAADYEYCGADQATELPWRPYGMAPTSAAFNIIGANMNDLPVHLIAVSKDECLGWENPQLVLSRSRISCDIRLNDNRGAVYGTVVGPAQQPKPGVTVSLFSLDRQATHVTYPPGNHRPQSWRCTTTTDNSGRFAFRNLPSGCLATLRASSSVWPAGSFTYVRTSQLNEYASPSREHQSNPCQVYLDETRSKAVFGKVVTESGEPLGGIELKVGEVRTSTNAAGEYRLAVVDSASAMEVISPPESNYFLPTALIDHKACRENRPQPPIKLFRREWVQGRVVKKSNGQPVAGVYVLTGSNYVGTSKDDGRFRVRVPAAAKELKFVPGWLTFNERELYESEKVNSRSLIWPDDADELDLGDVSISTDDSRSELQVRVLLPTGEPAVHVPVRYWITKKPDAPKVRVTRLTLRGQEPQTKGMTDQNGNCRVSALFQYEGSEYLTVTYPEIDPRYFGAIKLPGSAESIEIRLKAAKRIHGKITHNGEPMQGVSVRARPIAEQPVDPFRVLPFDGASGADGNYEVLVPESAQYEIELLPGTRFFNELVGNHPIRIANSDQESIAGPTFAIRSGDKAISGVVLGRNGREYPGAQIQLKLPPGQVLHRSKVRDTSGMNGEFTIRGLPDDAELSLQAAVYSPTLKGPPQLIELSAPVAAVPGDSSVKLKLTNSAHYAPTGMPNR